MLNLAAKVPTDLGPEFKTRVAACYQAPSRAIARQLAAGIRAGYADVLPSAFACFDDDFGACIAHLRLPVTHRRFARTTNLLERLFVEERRRLKIIPNGFGEKPVLKLMFGALIRAAERWRGLRHRVRAAPDRRRQKGTRPGIRGLDDAAGKAIPAPCFQQIRALTTRAHRRQTRFAHRLVYCATWRPTATRARTRLYAPHPLYDADLFPRRREDDFEAYIAHLRAGRDLAAKSGAANSPIVLATTTRRD